MITHREPGTTRFARYRSALTKICRGSSPTGTSSGASCNFSTCWSMNCDFSCTTKYGSRGHLSSFGPFCLPHVRGSVTPVKPELTARFSVCAQFRHWMCSGVAFELSVLAPMTMPGILTRWDTLVAVRPRMEVCETEEWISSWCSGSAEARARSSSLREG